MMRIFRRIFSLAATAALVLASFSAAHAGTATQGVVIETVVIEAAFIEAARTFQQARGGDASRIEPAIAAFEALTRAEPRQPLYAAYLGSALGLKAREAWMPWNKLKQSEKGLDEVDRALAALGPEHDREALRGVPVSLETRLVAASLFINLPDNIFHRRAAGRKLLDEVLRHPDFAAAPPGFRAAVQAAAHAAQVAREPGP